MQKPIRVINAKHRFQKDRAIKSEMYQDCAAVLKLAIGAPVRINCNLWVEVGIYNGASATVFDIIDDPDSQEINGLPLCVLVQMDKNYTGPSFLKDFPRIVPIIPKVLSHRDAKIAYSRTRTQIPLSLDWARTIHKAQGMTLTKAVIDINHAGTTFPLHFTFFK